MKWMEWFDQRGGVWVGLFSALTLVMTGLEFFSKGWFLMPEWWRPKSLSETGVYGFVLTLFVINGTFKSSRWAGGGKE